MTELVAGDVPMQSLRVKRWSARLRDEVAPRTRTYSGDFGCVEPVEVVAEELRRAAVGEGG